MGEDDLHVCAACGRQLWDHALSVRDDGVVVAGAYIDRDTFMVCGDAEPGIEPRAALAYEYP